MPISFDENSLPAAFRRGDPGTYEVRVRVTNVRTDQPFPKEFASTDAWTTAVQRQGVPARVLAVKYAGASNYRDTSNWAQGALDAVLGRNAPLVQTYDISWVVTVQILPMAAPAGMGVSVFAGALILLGIAAVLGTISAFTGKNIVLDGIRQVAEGIRDLITEPLKGAASGVLVLGAALLVVLFLAKKSGVSYKSDKLSF